jgi:glycosyltransferase involved in cell wall biosynthesis
MKSPSVSIVTINLNDSTGLERTIGSVAAQTFNDLEYVVVDGGSSDGSVEVIRKHAGRITRWISERDNGLYNAMNRGLAMARGRYVMFLNSADVLASRTVIEQLIIDGADADVIYGNIGLVQQGRIRELQSTSVVEYWRRYQHDLPPQPAMLIDRKLYHQHGGFDERYKLIADVVLISRIFARRDIAYRKVPLLVTIFDTSGVSSARSTQKRIAQERSIFLSEEFPHYLPALRDAINPRIHRRFLGRLRTLRYTDFSAIARHFPKSHDPSH